MSNFVSQLACYEFNQDWPDYEKEVS